MSRIQREHYRIARQAVIGCGGRIVKEITLEDGTQRIVFDGCDADKLRIVLSAMVPDSTFKKQSVQDAILTGG